MFFESMKSTLVRAVAGAISGALILGGVAIAPAAQAVGGVDQATSNFQMFSTPAVEYQEQALSTGASAEPLFNAGLQRIAGRTTFRAIFGAAPNRQISQYQMGPSQVLQRI